MEKISPIKEKILSFIEKMGITKQSFCDKTGISYANLKGKGLYSEIGGQQIGKILSMYPEISSEWLLTGSGEMLKSSDAPVAKHIVPSDNCVGIPLIPIDVVAGWNGIDSPGVVIADLDHYIIPEFIAAGAEYLIRVSGSSMYPKYSNGDILACRKVREITFFQWGKIYVIDSVQGAMVKRIFESKDTDHIVCHSDNDKYPPFELPKSEIRSLSIVIGVVRLE